MPALRWDIYCQVVDNFGDIGVCWRLAAQLAGLGHEVRLWVDDASALDWMAPQGAAGVQVQARSARASDDALGDVVVAAFGCALDESVVSALVRAGEQGRRVVWIHLEYLSAERYVARSHALSSPVLGGQAAGIFRWFFFPGFTADTGGLLREPELLARQKAFDRASWLAGQGVAWRGAPVISLFCYEPACLHPWLAGLAREPAHLLVCAGRAGAAVRAAMAAMPGDWNREQALQITFLPNLTQTDFDHLLWAADCNFVRGEDSLVRAIWAGAPLVWQAYPQDDGAHRAKLEAFLDLLAAPADLRRFHRAWNGVEPGAPPLDIAGWRPCVQELRGRLLAQDDLVTRLVRFVKENR